MSDPPLPGGGAGDGGESAPGPVLSVAVDCPLRRLFDYLPPVGGPPPAPGARVRVPFGRTLRLGIVVGAALDSPLPADRLRPVREVLDADPLVPPDLLSLLIWAAEYFHHPPGEVLVGTLPGPLRRGLPLPESGERGWRLTRAGREGAPAPHARRRRAILERLRGADGGLPESVLAADGGDWRGALAALAARGWVELIRIPREPPGPSIRPVLRLNPSQESAVSMVSAAPGFAAFLLDGVTGSGKTEVYRALIERELAAGRQSLVLIPEIGLTPQLVARLRGAIPGPVAVFHSGLPDSERAEAWRAGRDGEAAVVIGTRSAVFVPLARPGLFIVDEEHDASFKQQDGFRYSARDLAVVRARRAGCPVVLGSATPSLESVHNVQRGRYHELRLPSRAGGALVPRLELVDLRGQRVAGGLSAYLVKGLEATLERGEQSLLFLNRRGYATALQCHDCGWVAECPRCDAHLVLHQERRRLLCHHCGTERPVPSGCPACASPRLRPAGLGTERVVETLQARFPTARIRRMDRDSTRRRGSLETLLSAVRERRVDVLVGTQMLAKGHHFPEVTLVGILDADGGLFSADFRGGERMAQLLVQVAGRAGRGERPGRVLVQTHHPGHPLLCALLEHGYRRFGEEALAERSETRLPPWTALALLRAESPAPEPALQFLEAARTVGQPLLEPDLALLGPVPAPMIRRAGRHRAQLLVEAARRGPLHRFLEDWLPRLEVLSEARRVRWSLDVDPQEMS